MFNREIEAVLSLIAFTVFADKRVYSNEIQSFTSSANRLDRTGRSDIPLTEAKLLFWFETNRMQLQDKMRLGPAGLKRWLTLLMKEAKDFPDKSLILDLIHEISKADGELHISEKALSVLVAENGFVAA